MPRRFVFKLQPVLEQRERIEQQHQTRVAELERERLRVESRLRELQELIAGGRRVLREQLTGAPGRPGAGAVAIESVRMHASAELHLITKAQQAAIELAGVHQRLATARHHLAEATSARKAVDLLKQRRLEAFKVEQNRREAAELDEMMVMRHARRENFA